MITWAWCRRFGQRFPERRGSGVTHFVRNLQAHVPKPAQPMVATLVRSIFAQPSTAEVRAQLDRVITQLQETFPKAAGILADAAPDITAFCSFPPEHWRQIWSNNPQERLNREIRRRTDVVGIFPNRDSIIRLVGAVLAEQHDVRVGMAALPGGASSDDVPTACGVAFHLSGPSGSDRGAMSLDRSETLWGDRK